jgi:U6 snRNA-associated Sm-like protein LSm1
VLPSKANLVLTQTIERIYHPPSKSYAQTERGVFLVRGENVVLLGEVVRLFRSSFSLTRLHLVPSESEQLVMYGEVCETLY